MANDQYYEQLSAERTERTRRMLQDLPLACSDFIRSITMTTSPLTRMAYTIDLGTFCEYATKELPSFSSKTPREWTDEDLSCFTARDLHGYADYLTLYLKDGDDEQRIIRNHECGVMRKLSSLRSFFDFLFKQERIPGNIAALVSLPKLHEKPILYLINEEVDRLLSAANGGEALSVGQKKYHKLTRTRDVAILMLFLGTGIRVSECVGIDIDDLDFQLNAVLVTRKGGNQVILYFPQEVADALKEYLAERKKIETDKEHQNALFLSLQKKRITQRAVQLMVKKYCAVAVPLKKRMSPHKLRSTYATRLYHETEDIYLVADALGHSDVNTTRKHYAAMSDQRRREAARNVYLPSFSGSSDEETIIFDENKHK
ncbi:MAG: integrase [Clostridiales bacterium]|nr:integrase [Clostridiales bacterium]